MLITLALAIRLASSADRRQRLIHPTRPPPHRVRIRSASCSVARIVGHVAESHTAVARTLHSMTWSARARSEGGIVRPRALAVLRLMTTQTWWGPVATLTLYGTGKPYPSTYGRVASFT